MKAVNRMMMSGFALLFSVCMSEASTAKPMLVKKDIVFVAGKKGDSMTQHVISNMASPTETSDGSQAATKLYVDESVIDLTNHIVKGDKGDQGIQGIQGLKGDQGIQGIQGLKGDQGLQGIQGLKGDQGLQGIKGDKGDPGSPGVTAHSALTGLSNDDHLQYLKVSRSGTESVFSGRLTLNTAPGSSSLFIQRSDGSGGYGGLKATSDGGMMVFGGGSWLYLCADGEVACRTYDYSSGWTSIRASAFNVASSREYKTNISYIAEAECKEWLKMVEALRPATYTLNQKEGHSSTNVSTIPHRHLGLIAEEVPASIASADGKAVDLYALTTSLVLSMQQIKHDVDMQSSLKATVDAQQKEIEQLRKEIAEMRKMLAK